MSYSLAVDIGGTFTDIVLRHASGQLTVDKTLTTPHDLIEGFFTGVHAVLKSAGLTPRDVDGVVVHATTIVTNALIERKGLATALLVTDGFRDVLRIRNEHRYEMYDPQIEFPEPLVPPELTFGVVERIRADGSVLVEPDLQQVDAVAAQLKARNVRSLAICFLNSFANPANERIVGKRIGELLPDLFVTLSSDVAPQIREFPRASTASVNAYTMPISQPYLRRLSDRLAREHFPNAPLIMLSSGGVVGAETAGRNPVRMIESGPAAGALAACHYAEVLGLDRLMSFDMGGTTAKACLIENGEPLITGLFEVDRRYRFKEGSGLPVTIPSIDMIEIGAGGGSIAHVDALGLLKVGPQSAGSDPGPACYGRGGKEPTVTDADLVLGLLDADNFLGGDMKLDRAAADRRDGCAGEHPRPVADASGARHFPCRHRGDGGGGARACDRPRGRLPRHAAVRVRRRRTGACLRGGEPAAEHVGDRAAAAERAVGVRNAGDVAAARSRAQRSRPHQRARLGTGRPHPERARPRGFGRADGGRMPRRRASRSFSAPTCAISASRASSPSRSTPIRARIATPGGSRACSRRPIASSTASIRRTSRSSW